MTFSSGCEVDAEQDGGAAHNSVHGPQYVHLCLLQCGMLETCRHKPSSLYRLDGIPNEAKITTGNMILQ